MKELTSCPHCKEMISDTAIMCPLCLKETESEESSKFLDFLGHAMILPAISGFYNFSAQREEKKLAKELHAIDRFDLDDDIFVLVSEKHFFIASTVLGETSATPGFLRRDLHSVSIDESKSKKKSILRKETTAIRLNYFDTNYRKKEISAVYKYKGNNSLIRAKFTLAKLEEYME